MDKRGRIVLGITGSVAAYKAVELARQFVSSGYEVKAILTDSAQKFVGPALLKAITGNDVSTSLWENSDSRLMEHITLADWADCILIAPCSATTIAKITYGFADSALLATITAARCPLIIAPAMNVNMWENSAVTENIETLKRRKVSIVDPEVGDLACGWNGQGRLADIESILMHTKRILFLNQNDKKHNLAGKRVVITAGPTQEALDPVRFITNKSSGKMGISLAIEAFYRGADVTIIHGNLSINIPKIINSIHVVSANDMRERTINILNEKNRKTDILIMTAAVADFKPKKFSKDKIKKKTASLLLEMTHNPDILAELGDLKKKSRKFPKLVGFAVETQNQETLLAEMQRKLKAKNLDLVIGNLAVESFDKDTNHVWMLDFKGRLVELPKANKENIANKIFDNLINI